MTLLPSMATRLPLAVVRSCASRCGLYLGETGHLSQGVQAGRKALRTRDMNGMEVRKKRPRGFK